MSQVKYSLETEQEVLETIMHFGTHTNIRVQKAMLNLTADCFYNSANRAIFQIIQGCFNKQQSFHFVDILTLTHRNNELHDAMAWLMDNYRNCHAGESNFEGYISRLVTLDKLRKQLTLARKMMIEAENCPSSEDAQEILATALTEISGLSYRESKHGMSNMEIAEAYYDGEIGDDPKIPTTCGQLNQLLDGGFMPKSLIIVAAAPSVGKTGFSIYLTDVIARAQPDTESLFFSIEMEYKHIWMRHVGVCAGKPFDKLSDDERMSAVTKCLQVPMKIYDTNMCREAGEIDFILTTARLRAMEKPLSVIVVDYLGLIQNKGHFDRNDLKVSDITRKLAQLAIELNCSVILLTQINRGAANRGIDDRCPWPHDAADSSGSHNNANYWFGADRPELYQDDPCYRNQFVVKCRKNRFGDTFETIFAFNGGSFAEVEAGWFKQPVKQVKSAEKAIFNAIRQDIYQD